MSNEINWAEISAALRAPFAPEDVDFRPQGKPSGNGKVQAVCYIDARTVADRLDEVVGPGAWAFSYEPLVVEKGQVQIAKGRLTIHGVTKEDVGEASNFDPSKGCVSDALKRAAVLWGIGRYLYGVGGEWVTADNYGHINDGDVQRLRAKLPGAKQPTQRAFVATPKPLRAALPAGTRFATPDQWSQLRNACDVLHVAAPDPADNLTFDDAEKLLSDYRNRWKVEKQLHPPTVVGNGARHE